MSEALNLGVLFEHLPNALMVLDRELRYVTANAAYLRATGSHLHQLVGRYVFEAFPDDPDDPNSANVAVLRASFEKVLRSGVGDEIAALTYHVPRTPGGPLEPRVWSAKHTPIIDAAGLTTHIVQETTEVTHLVGTGAPLTHLEATVVGRAARVQETATALDSQLRGLRQLFDQAPGIMCFLNGPDHVFEIVNTAYLQLVGHRDIIGKPVAVAMPEVVAQGFVALLDNVFATGEPFLGYDIAVKLQRMGDASLEDRFVDFMYHPIRDAAGKVTGIFVQGQDVTPQHRAVRDRLAAEAHQRFFVESLPVQVWTSTPTGQLDFVNQRVTTYFDKSAEQILGDGWLGVLHPEDVDVVVQRWTHSLMTGDAYEVEFRLRRSDGQFRWHIGRADAERDSTGTVVRWFGTNTDIHDAKTALAELQARSQYEQRLLGIVSHDLRNPLNAIVLAGGVLADSDLDPSSRRVAQLVNRAATRATRLIQDLLDFAKKRIGATIPINPRPTNLREVVEQVVDELQVSTPSRVIRVEHAGDEDGSWDADRIAQVISNLVGNALQHGTLGKPIVVASSIQGDDVVLTVTNHGTPIGGTELAQLFEPFTRASNAGASKGSMGLGLFIAREVVVAHGGEIDVVSQAEGTCFTVRLPRFTQPHVG